MLINQLKEAPKSRLIFYSIVIVSCLASFIFVYHNHSFYDRPIAKVIDTTITDSERIIDGLQNEDERFTQKIEAVVKNGEHKGKTIYLTNEYSSSGAYDQAFQPGHELFVKIVQTEDEALTGYIMNVKRDKYVVITAWVFIFTLLMIGRRQGLFSVMSLGINIALLSLVLDYYVENPQSNLLWISAMTVILFTIISLLFVSGLNEKTYAAIVTTLVGTFASLLITYVVLSMTSDSGIYYEGMSFLTRPYRLIFLAGLFIGSLGAVMDVAITMSSSIFELYEKNKDISVKQLKETGLEIGRDVMGTITSILFFAYVSGSLPMLILYLKNGVPFGFTLSMNLSLEIARALAGGIGVVLTIPISLYTAIFFVQRKRARV
ncbi:MAG TPA: YibE/F family protein [Cerasibacillus sp.]|uniref:YibE/F family protein n=1 Tax=Cerasibacillus sp. TaxID=2498711 RepID=UPI002F3F7EBA